MPRARACGEITLGIVLGDLAQATSIPVGMLGSCALVLFTGILVTRAARESAP